MRTSALEKPEAPLASAAFSQSTTRGTPRAASAYAMLTPLTPPPTTTTSAVSAIESPHRAKYLIMWRARSAVSRRDRNGVSTHDGDSTVRDHRRRAPRRDLSLYPARDVAGHRGRGPLPGDVPAGLPRLPHAGPRGQRARVAVRHRDEPDPEPLSLRETPACRAPGRVGRAPRGRPRRAGRRGAVR